MICALCDEFPRVLEVHTCGREACDECRRGEVCCAAADRDIVDRVSRKVRGEMLSLTPEHYSPAAWVERGREVMGGIDFDPASCAVANETVQATVWYGAEQNGLEQEWHGRGWINPPGDETGQLPPAFFVKLAEELDAGRATEFVWLAFNISQLRTLQCTARTCLLLGGCSLFIPRKRIPFTGGSPTKDNAFLYYGPNHGRFREVFEKAGGVSWVW